LATYLEINICPPSDENYQNIGGIKDLHGRIHSTQEAFNESSIYYYTVFAFICFGDETDVRLVTDCIVRETWHESFNKENNEDPT